MERPAVSVVVPFHGDERDARALLGVLAGMDLRPGDEVLIADNTQEAVAVHLTGQDGPPGLGAFATRVKRSPYTARNEAAERAANDWLLFTDADCRPRPDLLDAYFAASVPDDCGALAGEVVGVDDQPGLIAAWARSRSQLSQAVHLRHPYRPMAVTANLLVRREAFAALGGFAEGVRSGGDADLCWRLQEAGWRLELRERAIVAHEHRESLGALLRQTARTSAGTLWLERRHPGSRPPVQAARELVRAAAGAVWFLVSLRPRRALFKLVDGAFVLAQLRGMGLDNRYAPAGSPDVVGVAGEHPAGTEVEGVERIEALSRPRTAPWPVIGRVETIYAEDDGAAGRLRARLVSRRLSPEDAVAARRIGAARVVALPGGEVRASLLSRDGG